MPIGLGRASWLALVASGAIACSPSAAETAPEAGVFGDDSEATSDSSVAIEDAIDAPDRADTLARDGATDAPDVVDVGDGMLDAPVTPFVPAPGCSADAGLDDATVPDLGEAGLSDADFVATPAWRSLATLNYARGGHFTFRIGDQLLVLGGSGGVGGTSVPPIEVYDPIADTWTVEGDGPNLTRAPNAAVLLADDRVLALVPGDDYVWPHLPRLARVYDSNFRVWSDVAPSSLCSPALVRLPSDRILAAGGGCDGPTRATEIYDPIADMWTAAAPMAIARLTPQLVPLGDGRVLAMGGDDGLDVEVYDPTADRWMLFARSPFGAVRGAAGPLPSGKVLIALDPPAPPSSATDGPTPFALLDPSCGTWTRAAWIPTRIVGEQLVVDRLGHVVTTGGTGLAYHSTATPQRATGVYDESTDRWTLLGPTAVAGGQTTTVMPSGSILMIGGSYSCGKMCSARYATVSVLDTPP